MKHFYTPAVIWLLVMGGCLHHEYDAPIDKHYAQAVLDAALKEFKDRGRTLRVMEGQAGRVTVVSMRKTPNPTSATADLQINDLKYRDSEGQVRTFTGEGSLEFSSSKANVESPTVWTPGRLKLTQGDTPILELTVY
jgi:hypothetical protein